MEDEYTKEYSIKLTGIEIEMIDTALEIYLSRDGNITNENPLGSLYSEETIDTINSIKSKLLDLDTGVI